MNSLAVQAARKMSIENARKIVKSKIVLPKNVMEVLKRRADELTMYELAYLIRNRVASRQGIEVMQHVRGGQTYIKIQKISKQKSLQMARDMQNNRLSLDDRRLIIGPNAPVFIMK